jgi:murein DD-endopeptidase MepM/ murein hydrolase activator NlpD
MMPHKIHGVVSLFLSLSLGFFSASRARSQDVYESGLQLPILRPIGQCDQCGYFFTEWADYGSYNVYHPGKDINVRGVGGNDDRGTEVYAIADGIVKDAAEVDPDTKKVKNSWGSLLIQHEYKGAKFYSQYGHMDHVYVTKNAGVHKGQKVGDIGIVGTDFAHLHFEIRTDQHENKEKAGYWDITVNPTVNKLCNLDNILVGIVIQKNSLSPK